MIVFTHIKSLAFAQKESQFIYNGFRGAKISLDGNSEVHANGLLQLTNTSKQQKGHCFYQIPLNFNSSSSGSAQSLSFSTNFVFAMVPELDNKASGHGIAFTVSPSTDFSAATAGEYLGLFNYSNNGHPSNHVFAVELDSILSPEFNDINDNHVGIDVYSLKSNYSAPVTYVSRGGENRSLELISGDPIQVWIDYDGEEKLINVTVAPAGMEEPKHPLISTSMDLSLIFLDSMYVGFSAATGAIASNHYVLGWSFNKSGKAQSLAILDLPSYPHKTGSKGKSTLAFTIWIIVLIGTVIVLIMGNAYARWKRKFEELREDWEREYGPRRFCYKDLYKATKGFRDTELLGSGGFGNVYRGVLPSSKVEVAVKIISHGSHQGLREFVAEIVSMGRLRHRNLAQLLGYCRRKGELILVYEYMQNGSLDKFLFGNEKPNLCWPQRFHILKGVASGLLYLHEEWEQVVLHRDVKASNVLLDADLNARLGDFGLARLHDHGANPQTTSVVGTVGYLAPELTRTSKATTGTDVYAFGAFMLEMACGRRPIQLNGLEEEIILVDWVFQCWKEGTILDTIDPRLESTFVVEEVELVLKLGLLCTHSVPAARPSMRQVMQYLNGDNKLLELPLYDLSTRCDTMGDERYAENMSFALSSGSRSAHSMSSSHSMLAPGR
ncbi:Serine-threonine/tyrosine-protein kinase, catalytic domain [Dillenia turbinata]|uniref:non-specific serine/threonine protein kinase n=1 Tax=Dillenia turbinata TaxID=194707 RepID=A0AAN8V3T1_9MAGN